ncbi:sulfur oxidation c-type cytochrome SoxX [Jhaorihella thermophila]|uniref:Sulfur-oxidizing protein SoxX n=1 Tax=Jhaorihella thermophila TaxID=488547 RepID=A0A1H5X182_9RHOB|nr:sulfur oxidation c-type cytochrome SoxX [Jhaorihella thermophila]SEG05562.1 sulfur-oxidizing protein SoxX [Jhaorihella thermophila]
MKPTTLTLAVSLTDTPGDPVEGASIAGSKKKGNCVACHQVSALPDVPFQGDVGPSLDGVGNRWDAAQLRGILVDAKKTFPDTVMPSFHKIGGFIRPGNGFTGKAAKEGELKPLLGAQQIEDVIAFLATLKE